MLYHRCAWQAKIPEFRWSAKQWTEEIKMDKALISGETPALMATAVSPFEPGKANIHPSPM